MTWEELNLQYEKKRNQRFTANKKTKSWKKIMESTDKLLWLYLMSDSKKNVLERI